MNLHKLIFTQSDAYKAGVVFCPKGVMVHSTGANNPELRRYVGPDDGLLGQNQYNNHWNMLGVGASVHAFIGKLADGSIATYQVLPFNIRAGHCKFSGNDTHLAFEICEDDLGDPVYFSKVYREAVELTAMLCVEHDWDPMADGVVICHSEGYQRGIASNHGDVMHWFPKHGKSMDTFRADVKALLDSSKDTAPAEKPVAAPAQLYRVRKSWADAKSQIGAYRDLENAKHACKHGYSVFDEHGEAVYSKAATSAPAEKVAAATVKVDAAVKGPDKSKVGTYRVKSADGVLNLRAGASSSKALIEAMPNGTKVTCYGYYTGSWLFVVSETGKKGFCHSAYLVK